IVPEVPRLTVTTPTRTLPVPIAPIILSPAPELTITLSFNPNSAASSERNVPAISSDVTSGGSISIHLGSITLIDACHHLRFRTSSSAVPEASPHSIVLLPVNQKLM